MNVSKEAALFFKDQCCGQRYGDMSYVPNNPVMFGFMSAHSATDIHGFVEFLEKTVSLLKKDLEKF